MSLEQAIQDNTLAIRDLIAAMSSKPIALTAAQAEEVLHNQHGKAKKEKPVAEPVAEPVALTYDDVKKPFLSLVTSGKRDAALAILKDLGVPDGGKLTEVPQSKWAECLEMIQKASV